MIGDSWIVSGIEKLTGISFWDIGAFIFAFIKRVLITTPAISGFMIQFIEYIVSKFIPSIRHLLSKSSSTKTMTRYKSRKKRSRNMHVPMSAELLAETLQSVLSILTA